MALSANLNFYAQFSKSGAGVTGKSGSITVTIKKVTRGSSPTITTVTTGGAITVGSVTEIDATNNKGLYVLGVTGLDPTADYTATAHYTGTSTDVDNVDVPALQTEFSATINAGAIPQVLASSANGLPTVGTGTGQIQLSSGQITVGSYAIGEDPATQVLVSPSQKIATDSSNRVTITQAFPTNFSSMLVSGGGAVTVGTNNDKTGYGLTGNVTVGGYATGQDPATYILVTPANKLATDSSNRVTASSVSGNVQGNVNGGVLGNGVFVLSSPGVIALLDSTDTTAMSVALNLDAKISTRAVPGSQMDLVNAPNATAMNAFADALLDRVQAIDPSGSAAETVRKALRLLIGPIVGKMSGAGTGTNTFTDSSGTINRIVATVDSSGNRTAVTYNP